MAKASLRKVLIALPCAVALFVICLPLGLYGLGLSNIEGRPKKPILATSIVADASLLHLTFHSEAPIEVHVLNPWTYVGKLQAENAAAPDSGAHAVWLVVRNYNSQHLKNHKMTWWHLSGAALTIWVTRNWTASEIVTAAAAIVRSTFPSFDSSSLVEVGSLRRLPKELGALLGADWKCCGMVDAGEEFYPTDVAGGPDKRFLLAGLRKENALVAYEWGNGWERGIDAAAYVLAGADWHLIARWRLDFKPGSLSELKDATTQLPREIVKTHYFDAEPSFAK